MTFVPAEGTLFSRGKDTAKLQPQPDEIWVDEIYVTPLLDETLPLNDGHLGDQH